MTTKRTFLISLVAVASIASASGIALAQQPEMAADLSVVQIVQKLESLGYTAIEDIEKDDGVWEVEATSPNGTRVELDLDLKDGRVLSEERDADDDDRPR